MKNPQSTPRLPTPSGGNQQSLLTPLDYAYRLLARRAYSEQELADKLLSKGFTEAAVSRTITRLKEQGYLNDASFAADQTERLRARGVGAQGIKAKLLQKGIAERIIEQRLENDGTAEEIQSARQLLASRFSADALKQSQYYARAFRFLLGRGYGQEVVESLLGSPPSDARETDIKTRDKDKKQRKNLEDDW